VSGRAYEETKKKRKNKRAPRCSRLSFMFEVLNEREREKKKKGVGRSRV